jgi:hypothetical protein
VLVLDLPHHLIQFLHDRPRYISSPYDRARPGDVEDADERPIVPEGAIPEGAILSTLEPGP